MKIGKTTLKLARLSTPSVPPPVEKKPSRPSTPAVDTTSDRERTPAVTTRVRVVERSGSSSKPSTPAVPTSVKETIVHRTSEKPPAKDPFMSFIISSPPATRPVTRSRPAARQPVVIDLTISEDESGPDVTGTPGVDSLHVRILLRSPICGIDLARRLRLRSTRERNNHTAHVAKDKELKKSTWNAKVIDRR
ncbi:hypothetical protein BDV93DRAFT_565817 [Ceratobasidium sp. AG-I]|nr:hypothetical protein BDV93DRAFT_565817 [Ceratobasidium sp. AG-I]